MKILFSFNSGTWQLRHVKNEGQQYDNLTATVRIEGSLPAWPTGWKLLLKHGNNLDEATLSAVNGGLEVVLTAEQLAFSGMYEAQLKATEGDYVKHSNKTTFRVNSSLSGDAQWPTIPTEFSQAVQRAETAAETAEEAAEEANDAASDAEHSRQAIENMDATAESLEPGNDPTVTKHIDPETGAVTLQFGIPQGEISLLRFEYDAATGETVAVYPKDGSGYEFFYNENTGELEVEIA